MTTPEINITLVLNELKSVIAEQAQEIAILKATLITLQNTSKSGEDSLEN